MQIKDRSFSSVILLLLIVLAITAIIYIYTNNSKLDTIPVNDIQTNIDPKPASSEKVATTSRNQDKVNKTEKLDIDHISFYKYSNNIDKSEWTRYPDREKYGETTWEMYYPDDWTIFGENYYLSYSKSGANIEIYFYDKAKELSEYVSEGGFEMIEFNGFDGVVSSSTLILELNDDTHMHIAVSQFLRGDNVNLEDKYIFVKEAFTIINTITKLE